MGTVVESVAVARPNGGDGPPSSVDLATRAALDCLARAGCAPSEVGLLVNTGVYRDENICEPAMASFVQRRIGANLSSPPQNGRRTLAFDVMNGACGVMNALHVTSGFVGFGRFARGLVVTSDVDPTPRVSEGVHFAPAGAALLLAPGPNDEGFSAFHFQSFTEHAHLCEGDLEWIGTERGGESAEERHAIRLRRSEALLDRSVECAVPAFARFAARAGLSSDDLDLLVASPASFAESFATTLGIEEGRVAAPPDDLYTAGLPAALARALQSGQWDRARRVLFATAGSGITVGFALYARTSG